MRARFSFFTIFAVLLVTLSYFVFSGEARSEVAPDWALKDLNGKTIKLSDYKGKVVVLNFWATYCPPCILEIPDFIAVQKEFEGKNVVIIGLSTDSLQPAEVAGFAARKGMNYPIVMLSDAVGDAYNVEIIPMTVIVKPDGKIDSQKVGVVSKEYLESSIKKLLPSAH